MRILAATDFSTRSQRALRRAGLLARDAGAHLSLVHVVDDDQPAGLIELETREAERYLREHIDSTAELREVQCDPIVVSGDAFDGILRTAQACSAEIIVMGAHRKHLLRDILIGTTIERVIRTGPYPVLMVNGEVTHAYARAIAAVDESEASTHAIKVAKGLGLIDRLNLSLVHGVLAFTRGTMSAGMKKSQIDDYMASERSRASAELLAFLNATGIDVDKWPLRVTEGGPLDAMTDAIRETQADLLIIGTSARSGIAKILLGSVTEEALRSIDVDILVVPPPR